MTIRTDNASELQRRSTTENSVVQNNQKRNKQCNDKTSRSDTRSEQKMSSYLPASYTSTCKNPAPHLENRTSQCTVTSTGTHCWSSVLVLSRYTMSTETVLVYAVPSIVAYGAGFLVRSVTSNKPLYGVNRTAATMLNLHVSRGRNR